MKSRTSVFVLFAGLLVMPLAAEVHAKATKAGSDASKGKPDKPSYSVTVEYTGVLAGVMEINSVKYRLARDVSIYVNGRGAVPVGIQVQGASLFMTGEKHADVVVVRNILVGPGAANSRGGRGQIRPRVTPQ